MVFRSCLSVLCLLLTCVLPAFSQESERTMQTFYTEALLFTPINMTIGFTPQSRVNPGLSASAEYSIRVGSGNGIGLAAGFHPTPEGHESIGQLTWRMYSAENSPIGSFYEVGAIGGVGRMESNGEMSPIIGITARMGSLRQSRFGWMSFGYGLGPAVMLVHGKLHARITMNFGLGVLLGKQVVIK
jgi:hypothetical protein